MAGALLLVSALHAPLLAKDPLLTRDDERLVRPLATIQSLADYRAAMLDGRVLDLQPVRDFSFALNLWLEARTGFGAFHLFNLLLWAGCVLLAWKLFSGPSVPPWRAAVGAALVALHPVFSMSVAWVSARKHLLACCFILLATLLFRRLTRKGFSAPAAVMVLLSYVLSLFSQPITLLWPLWAAWETRQQARERRRPLLGLLALLGVCALLGAWANAHYYATEYAAATGYDKFTSEGSPGTSLLALGRAFANLVLPVALATTYDPGRWLNLAGLFALVPFAAWVALKSDGEARSWGLFALLPLAVVLGRTTNVFLFDTYLLAPGIGLAAVLVHLAAPFDSATPRVRLGAVVAAVGLAGFFAAQTWSVVGSWTSDERLWQHAYAVEPTPASQARVVYYLAGTARAHEAVQLALELAELEEPPAQAASVLGRAVTLDPQLSRDERERILKEHPSEDPWYLYFLGALRAAAGDWREGSALMWKGLRSPADFKLQLGTVTAEAHFLCVRAGEPDCEARVAALRSQPLWSQPSFLSRSGQLQGR